MKAFAPLWKREFWFFFRTPVAYVVGVFLLLCNGYGLWTLAGRLAREEAEETLSAMLFGSPSYWLAMLASTSLLSMGLFAEERRRGSLELLLTAPVTETVVVLAKFFGALSAFLVLWLPTLAYGGLLALCGIDVAPGDWGPVWAGYVGTAAVGALLLSVGLFCSLLTRHQAAAAVATLATGGLLLLAGSPQAHFPTADLRAFAQWISPLVHVADFAAGTFDTRTLAWHAGATALLLFLCVRFLEARRLGGSPFGATGRRTATSEPVRRWARRANLAAAVLLAALNVALVNLLAARYPARFHWTSRPGSELSERTLQLLDSVAEDVRVVALVRPSNEAWRPAAALLREYAVVPNVSVEWVDPDRDLARAEQAVNHYRIDGAEGFVFEIGGRHRFVPAADLVEFGYPDDGQPRPSRFFRGETLFSSAIHGLTQTTRPAVHFVQGHGERSPDDFDRRSGYSRIAARLRDDNLDVEPLNLGATRAVPSHCALMVVAGPVREFTPFELSLVRDYLDRKGRLLLLLDARTRSGLEPLLRAWGIQLADDVVVDPSQTLSGRDLHLMQYPEHPITAPLQGLATLFYLPRSVRLLPLGSGSDKPTLRELATSSAQGWAELDPDAPAPRYDPQVDVAGPVPIAVAIERGPVPGVHVQIQPTRIVVVGDSGFASNGGLTGANADFFLNAVNWLLGREELLAIAPRAVDEIRLAVSARQLRGLFGAAGRALPGLVGIVGMIATWRRRRP